MVLTYIQERI